MKRYLLLIAAFVVALSSSAQKDWAAFARYQSANTAVLHGARAVFMGNSITDGWASQRTFFDDNGYIGRGISGQTSSEMLVRFRADVLELEPQCVVILAGTNDIAMNNGEISLENIFGNIVSMSELARAHKIKVVLCSLLPVYDFPWREGLEPAPKIIALNKMLKQYADTNKIAYADYHSAMVDNRGGLPANYAGDGVHPTAQGYMVMEGIIRPIIEKLSSARQFKR